MSSKPERVRGPKSLIDLKETPILENADDESSSCRSQAGAEGSG